jgi:hypothetical protein
MARHQGDGAAASTLVETRRVHPASAELALWDRADRAAVETVAVCVVDLPTGLLIDRRPRTIDTTVLLDAAVRAVLAQPLPRRRRAGGSAVGLPRTA